MASLLCHLLYASLSVTLLSNASPLQYRTASKSLDDCSGYSASNVKYIHNGLTADLKLSGEACNVYGADIEDLTLTVEYQTSDSAL
jgi:alpha-glucosidase